jgi:hypothetical protein
MRTLLDILKMAADGMGPGAIGVSTPATGVISPDMRKKQGKTQVEADASPSDLASHHTWKEPSATDVTIRLFRKKRQREAELHRNMEVMEWEGDRAIYGSRCPCLERFANGE